MLNNPGDDDELRRVVPASLGSRKRDRGEDEAQKSANNKVGKMNNTGERKGVRDVENRRRNDYSRADADNAKISRIQHRGTAKGKEVNPGRKAMADFHGSTTCSREGCLSEFPPHKIWRPHGSGWKSDCYCRRVNYRGHKDLRPPIDL